MSEPIRFESNHAKTDQLLPITLLTLIETRQRGPGRRTKHILFYFRSLRAVKLCLCWVNNEFLTMEIIIHT